MRVTDDDVEAWLGSLDLPGIVDIHVHAMPDSIQQAVWRHFDNLSEPWPIAYRDSLDVRLATLTRLGVRRFPTLAYAHRAGVAAWLNDFTLTLAEQDPRIVPTFTVYPEADVDDYVALALERGGACVKVHLQVGKFAATDPLLDSVWSVLEARRIPIVLHAGAVADGSGGEEWCGPEPVRHLLSEHPGLRLIIAHLGAPEYDAFIDLALEHAEIGLDTANVFNDPPVLGTPPIHRRHDLMALGDRVYFGSDFPTIPRPFSAQLSAIAGLGWDEDWLRKVLWDNGARLFGVPTGA
jgi:predicted TIM-barrel fold metal-dependent hydrolase